MISSGILERAIRGVSVDASKICRKSRDGIVSGGSPDTIQSSSLLVDFPFIVQVAKFSGVLHNASTRERQGSFARLPLAPSAVAVWHPLAAEIRPTCRPARIPT